MFKKYKTHFNFVNSPLILIKILYFDTKVSSVSEIVLDFGHKGMEN